MALRFVPMTAQMVRTPITLDEAIERLGPERFVEDDPEPSMDYLIHSTFKTRQILTLSLLDETITAYIWSPSSGWFRVPRNYWHIPGMGFKDIVNRGAFTEVYDPNVRVVEVPDDLVDQRFVVWLEDIDKLRPIFARLNQDHIIAMTPDVPASAQDHSDILPDAPSAAVSPKTHLRGTLPGNAKANDRKHEEYAHLAAAIVRDEGILPQKAFGCVAQSDPMRKPESVISAIRRSYELMYDRRGQPLNN